MPFNPLTLAGAVHRPLEFEGAEHRLLVARPCGADGATRLLRVRGSGSRPMSIHARRRFTTAARSCGHPSRPASSRGAGGRLHPSHTHHHVHRQGLRDVSPGSRQRSPPSLPAGSMLRTGQPKRKAGLRGAGPCVSWFLFCFGCRKQDSAAIAFQKMFLCEPAEEPAVGGRQRVAGTGPAVAS